jgi:hypothetical protein
VQTVVTELLPQAIFCAVETSGEGAVNFYSRVQMSLFKAKQRAQHEMDEALAQYGITREQAQEFLRTSRYGHTLYKAPHAAAGTGADLIHEIGPLVGKGALGRARVHVKRTAERTRDAIVHGAPHIAARAKTIAPHVPALARWMVVEGLEMIPAAGAHWTQAMKKMVLPSDSERESIRAAEKLASAAQTVVRAAGRVGKSLRVVA